MHKYAKDISKRIYDLLIDLNPLEDMVSSSELSQSEWKTYTTKMNEIINKKMEKDKELQNLKKI